MGAGMGVGVGVGMKSSVSPHHHCVVFYNDSMPFSYDINPEESARAKRRLKSQPSGDVEVKALGSNLGQIARGRAVYDPNALDGDGDGIVQDSTPFERPAALSNIAALSRGFASATGRWGDSFENWTVGKTNEEIAEVAVPDNPTDLIAYITAHVGVHGLPTGFSSVDELLKSANIIGANFDPETIARTRAMLVRMLENNPEMREFIDRFGIPATIVQPLQGGVGAEAYKHVLISLSQGQVDLDQKLKPKWMTAFGAVKDTLIKKFGDDVMQAITPEGVDTLPDTYLQDDSRGFLEHTFIHEYGHYLNYQALLNHPNPDFRKEMFFMYNASWSQLENNMEAQDGIRSSLRKLAMLMANPRERQYGPWDPEKRTGVRRADPMSDIMPPSAYAATKPVELMAELFVQYVKTADKKSLNPETRILMETLTGRKTPAKGFFSASRTLPGARGFDDMSIEEIVDSVVPSTPEQARKELESWSQWMFDSAGPGYFDVDTEGMTAAEKVNLEMKRMKFHIDKNMEGSWSRVLRKARRSKEDVKPEDVFDFSQESLMGLRDMVSEALANSPEFLQHVKDFGMPPLFVLKGDNIKLGGIFNGSTGSMFIAMNKLSLDPTPLENPDDALAGKGKKLAGTEWFLESNGNWKTRSILYHEYGHFINYLASNIHPDRETRYLASWYWRMDWNEGYGWRSKRKWQKFRKENPGFKYDAADRRWQQIEEITDAINRGEALDWENGPPHVMSQYGQMSPAETFAEGYGAWMSGEPEQIARISPALMNDIKMHVANPSREEVTVEVDMTQAMQRPTGFASLSIKRDEYGTRDLAAALDGSSQSPLDGSNWLKDATPKEIAQAIVPRTREDAVNLMLMNLLVGNRNPDAMTMAAMRSILSKMLDTDIFDFSPEGVSQMEKWIEKALEESPQFLWQVRRFGSLPMIPTDRKAVAKYRNALENGTPIPILSMNAARIETMTYPFTGTNLSAEQEAMNVLFDCSVASPGTMGYCVGSLFMVMNMHHREWRGVWDPKRSKPPAFGRTRRVNIGVGKDKYDIRPWPEKDKYGRTLISNFGTSLEGTIIHEWGHGWFSGLFGPKQGLGIVPEITAEVARKGGVLDPNARVTEQDLFSLGGNRKNRYAYFYPDLSLAEAEARVEFAKDFMSPGSMTIIPVPESPRDIGLLVHFMQRAVTKAQSIYGPGSPEVMEITQRMNDYGTELGDRGLKRLLAFTNKVNMPMERLMYQIGIDPNDPDQVQSMAMFYGYEPGINQDTWQGLAQDFPDIFGDPALPFATLAGQYAQKNPQETWAELTIQMAQPDADYRDEYITPELKAALLYVFGEHDDPFDTNITDIPWETRGGFASRTQKVEHARATVLKRSSNTLGNVVSSRSTIDDRASRVVKSTRDERGHTRFEIGDYTFTIPGDKFMPDLSSAYTEWASESHYGIQQMSRMMMGVQPSRKNPLSMPGNIEINAIRSGRGVSELDERMLSSIRSTAAKTNRILDEVRDSDSYSSMPLYHALNTIEQDSDIFTASVGDTISMPLSSFSPNFINPDMVTNRGGGDGSAVIKLSIGAKVMESNLLENTSRNGEWRDVPIESITGGKFRVISKGERDGIPVIEIEHTDVFDTTSGEWMNVDPNDAMSSVRYEVLTDRGMKELEKLNRRRIVLKDGDPEYGTITEQMDTVANGVVRSMFGDNTDPILPVLKMSSEDRIKFEEQMEVLATIPVSSMDKRGLPGFASVTDANTVFGRTITPERRVNTAAVRMLQENREYIADRMLSGTNREVLDDVWVDKTLEKLNNGEITHADGMNIMNVIMDVISDRIKKDPSVRDATDGDIYNYQKLGKRLRRAMTAEVTAEEINSPRKATGFASNTSNTDKRITERFNPTVISTQASDAEWGQFETSREIVQAVVYDINGEKVAFGIEERHGLDTTGIKVIELNPYEITGLKRGTPEGEEMALDWVYADSYLLETGDHSNHNGTEISALLYAATKGDKEAEKQFKEYAEKGRAIVKQKYQEELDAERKLLDTRLSDGGVQQAIRTLQTRLAALRRKKADGYYGAELTEEDIANAKWGPKDLVLVRWSQFPPEYDDEGNIIVHPASKYLPVDRETIHFTLNHAVEEHMFWSEGDEGGYLITVPLQDVIDSNGLESLDNLYGIDTYFTPKQGKGLKLPKAKVRKVEKGEDRKAITREIMETEYDTLGVAGGSHYTDTAGFEDTVRLVARDLGIPPGALHASQPHKQFEQLNNYADENGNRNLSANANNNAPFTFAPTISTMERNALLAIADRQHAKWSGVNESSVKNPAGSFVSVTRSNNRLASLKNAEEIRVINSIQNKIGFVSRTDAVNPRGKTVEEVAEELELTEGEKKILAGFLPNFDNVENYAFHPSITPEQRQKIIDSVRVRVDGGIPYITIDGHPFLVDEIPDKRDWSTVLSPTYEQIQEIGDLLVKLGKKLGTATYEKPNNMGFTLEEEDRARQHIKLNIVAFSQWAMDLYRSIGNKYPVLDDSEIDQSNIPNTEGGMIYYTGMGLYFNALTGLLQSGIIDYFGEEDFLNAHDLWGHIATGRSFDRHGEWANALAMWSMMDRWAEENNIPESDVIRMKLRWMTGLEFDRFSFRKFVNYPDGITDTEKIELQLSAYKVLNNGMATDDEIKQLLALLDHGSVAQSENAKKLVDATPDEKAGIVKTDVVRTTLFDRTKKRLGFSSASNVRRIVDMDMPVRNEDSAEFVAREMGLSERALNSLRDSMDRSLEAISSGRLFDYVMATGSEPHKSRLLNAIRVALSKNDIPMMIGDPHPVIFTIVPDKRDWSLVEIPSPETVQRALQMIRDNQSTLDSIANRSLDVSGSRKFYSIIGEKLNNLRLQSGRQQQPSQQMEDELADEMKILGRESWASLYLGGLFSNDDWAPAATAPDEEIHDAIGHIGIGRGFDRHGEFANALAVLSLLKDPDVQKQLTKREIDSAARRVIGDYLLPTLVTNGDGDAVEILKLGRSFMGDPFALLDIFESEIDKTPALNNDGSPIKPRSTGFASSSRLSLEGVKPEVRDRIVLADTAHLSRNKTAPRIPGKTPEEITTSIRRVVGGFASRTTPTNPAGKSIEEVAKDIELTPDEVKILEKVLPDISSLRKMEVNPSLKDKKEDLINSVRVAVVDGIPFVYASPNPMLSEQIPDKRDWSAVVRPKAETAEKVRSLVEEMVKTTLDGKTAEAFYDILYSGQDSPERKKLVKRMQDAQLLRFTFADWSNNLLKDIASKNPFDSGSNEYITGMGSEYGEPVFLQMWAQGLQDLRSPALSIFSPENETDGMHDMWGHVGIGRGFDRHGEWANMFAMFSLMDRWADENNISKDDLTLTKASWFNWLEYRKIGGEFTPRRSEINKRDNADAHDVTYTNAILGADIEQLEKLIALIDDGNTHDTGKAKGFASASSNDKAEIVKKDIVRQTMMRSGAVDSKPTVFASRTGEFKVGTHNIETDNNAPEADMFTADERGHTVQVFVPEGVEVINPRTGKKMVLDSPGASVAFVEDGGNLSEVPDAHAIEAILNNAENVPGERKSGWRFSKPDGRFEWLGGGGGATGMMRLKDRRTNLIFGIKFEASFMAPEDDKYGEWTSPFPITDTAVADAPEGIVNEVVGQAVLQALGFEPGATRVVKRSTRGAGDKNGGAALIVEFAQNRYNRTRDADDYAPMTVRKESAIRMLLLDAILANRDRNPQNFLTSIQSDGTRVIIPIDHGAIMANRLNNFDLKGAVSSQMGWNAIEYEKILDDMTRAELIAIMPSILADYRADIEQKKADIVKAMNEAVDKLISLHEDGEWPDMDYLGKLSEEYDNRLKAVFSRLDEVASMSDEDFLELFKYLKLGYK